MPFQRIFHRQLPSLWLCTDSISITVYPDHSIKKSHCITQCSFCQSACPAIHKKCKNMLYRLYTFQSSHLTRLHVIHNTIPANREKSVNMYYYYTTKYTMYPITSKSGNRIYCLRTAAFHHFFLFLSFNLYLFYRFTVLSVCRTATGLSVNGKVSLYPPSGSLPQPQSA